jgi:hypothetical protein
MKFSSNTKGQLAVSKTELRALELGYIPSRPLCDTRYDLIIDINGVLKKIQVKYANGLPSKSKGSIVVKLSYEDRKKQVFTYKDCEVDGLIVYIPKIDKLCFIPNNIFTGKRNLCIRLERCRNNQKKGIIYAKDYYW